MGHARARLKSFRQASLLAVALTSFVLLLVGAPDEAQAQDTPQAPRLAQAARPTGGDAEPPRERAEEVARETQVEAQQALQGLREGVLGALPKLMVALAVLALTWLVVRGVRTALHAVVGRWARADAAVAMVGIALWLLGTGIAMSVVAGDIRAMLGSVGLVGLALSWALQTPIESFTGWLLNSFQGYYRVGDRIEVGEVHGDVYRIDFLTTTVWELGRPERAGSVPAGQPTGRLITFPNNEVLTGNIVNLTQDFPYHWDDLTLPIANESDVRYALEVVRRVAAEVLGPAMAEPAREYQSRLSAARLEASVSPLPEVYVSLGDAWINLSIRYLVHARQRRRWRSELTERLLVELARPEHAERILSALPRQQVQFLAADGRPVDSPPWPASGTSEGNAP